MVVNIADTLAEVAVENGSGTGVIEARTGRSLSFAELDTSANRYASYFSQQGICQKERVMLMVRPSADFISLTFALFRLGAPVILIDPGMGYKNLLRCIEAVSPDYLVGIPPVIAFRKLFRKPFKSIKKHFSCGSWLGLTGCDIRNEAKHEQKPPPRFDPTERSLAAIIFTTGSTGPPKGVRFEHSIFAAQLRLIRDYYAIGPQDIDQPGFPLFALFSIALGACAVIPDMDPTKPAQVDPAKFVESIDKYKVTYSFGSPAIWNVVSSFCHRQNRKCKSLKKVLMAGAPVSGALIDRVYSIMPEDGEIYTPYGATESLPIVSIEGKEVINETWKTTINGGGTCVGRPLPGISVKVIESSELPFVSWSQTSELAAGEIGEIVVKGAVVTRAYENNEPENKLSKITDSDGFWHRIGDVGYFDRQGRLWFCGRKAHRVHTANGIMYTIPCEAVVNEHPDVFRSALVGIDSADGFEVPVLIIEKAKNSAVQEERLLAEVRKCAENHSLTRTIDLFLVHPSFPVDIRHNAKIFREKLKKWAQHKIG